MMTGVILLCISGPQRKYWSINFYFNDSPRYSCDNDNDGADDVGDDSDYDDEKVRN